MADFAPPPGPPPPKVPEGWKAVWNPQYSEWFFVNIYTKQSQWEKPNDPVYPPGEGPPHGAPPGYAGLAQSGAVSSQPTGASEKSGFGSNNPYANMSEDEKLARKLQEEEEVRAGRHSGDMRGQANDYYHQPQQPGGYGQQNPVPYAQGGQSSYQDVSAQDKGGKGKSLLGKLLGKATGSSSSGSHGYPPQQQGYGQPPGYGGAPGGYYGGGGYQQRPMGMPMGGGMMGGGRRPGGGMGAGGAMALGAGGGLLGGAMLGSAMADGGDGGDFGGDGGGDYGGGDYGGGDFGGGDMGGGDGGGGGD